MSTCNTCNDSPCIGVPMNASTWNTPNFTGCELGSLPPGICEGFDCIEKIPACSIEGGHALKLIKLSNYIDLDKLAGLNPELLQVRFDNEVILSKITKAPITGAISGMNTVAHNHCNGEIQIDVVSPFPLTQTQKVKYSAASGSTFFVVMDQINEDSVQVFVNGILQSGYTINYNGTNTSVILAASVTNVCVEIYWQGEAPEVVLPDTGKVKVSDDDVEAYLENKISGGAGITITPQTFGSSEYLEISLTNPIPTPSATDTNKIVYVDENGDYQLGSPCCNADKIVVTGTDEISVMAENNVVEFNSDDLDITAQQNADGEGVDVLVNLKDGIELFSIANISGSEVHPVEYGTNLVFQSSDNSVAITVTDGVVDFVETPQTLHPISYVFTNGAIREVELGDTIEYKSESLEILVNGDEHSFELKELTYGGRTMNGEIETLGTNETIQVPFSTTYSNNNGALISGNTLVAQNDSLNHITTQVGVIFADASGNNASIALKVNGNIRGQDFVFGIDASQYGLKIDQYLELNDGDVVSVEVTSYSEGFTINSSLYTSYLFMTEVR